jgi:hypothetical protein
LLSGAKVIFAEKVTPPDSNALEEKRADGFPWCPAASELPRTGSERSKLTQSRKVPSLGMAKFVLGMVYRTGLMANKRHLIQSPETDICRIDQKTTIPDNSGMAESHITF